MSNDINAAAVRFRVMAAVMVASGPLYAVVGTLIVKTGGMTPIISGDLVMVLGPIALVLAAAVFAASFPIRRALAASSDNAPAGIPVKIRATLIVLALSEVGAILGLILVLLSQRLDWPVALWICSFANGLALFPRRAWIVEGLEQ